MSTLSTAEIMVALRARYAAPEFAFLEQVRNGTGFSRRPRTADALAMSTWPSRGLELYGFEVKASRSDWLREKADPEKAEEIAQYCDRWVIVVGDETIVQPGELPPTWGLLVPKGKKLVCKVEAPRSDAKPITKAFLAAILRSASETVVSRDEVRAEVAAALDKARKSEEERYSHVRAAHERELTEIRARVSGFEEASGVKLDRWSYGPIGAAVRLVLEGGADHYRARLEQLGTHAKRISTELEQQIAELCRVDSQKPEAAE